MTYKELAEAINRLPEENQKQDATVYLESTDEFIPVEKFLGVTNTDVLDAEHPVIVVAA